MHLLSLTSVPFALSPLPAFTQYQRSSLNGRDRGYAIDESLLVDKPGTEQGMPMGLATIIALAKGD